MIRIPHSSGRYPLPRWKMRLVVTQLTRRGERVTTWEKDYEVRAKVKRTAIARVLQHWQKKYLRRIGRSTVVEVKNMRRTA